MKALAIITARGGSKGLPRKNVLPLAGEPLIAWTIKAALAAHSIDRVILSSDDPEIIEVARDHGCDAPFIRPAALAGDDVASLPVLHHAMDAMKNTEGGFTPWSHVMLLQPTSPLRTAADIDAAAALCEESKAPACIAVTPVDKPIHWMYKRLGDGRLSPAVSGLSQPTRRQDAAPVFVPNGAIYIASWAWIRSRDTFMSDQTVGYVMPPERSIDIDSPLDFALSQLLLEHALNGQV